MEIKNNKALLNEEQAIVFHRLLMGVISALEEKKEKGLSFSKDEENIYNLAKDTVGELEELYYV
ncbi:MULTISPECIES: hypothetical protein [unclassified Virgibacillus]|uniref:hypothetical protein n=1 Tax=unclassified Virgibacillus TaxID=2620237 RepID=UPI00090B3CAA|nr:MULTISPECIES: hypothetical protein [unclassified Virgibacillus]API92702.1 hypothetical protein BKP57_13340 [Virgibacillus sp. 6R]MBS7428198.1 hypothetical protein [Virgibacillus sp. 19R1-5]